LTKPLVFFFFPVYHTHMSKKIITALLILISFFLLPASALAVCPVCTVAVGAGLGVSRALGIDDAVTSVWIGGLILSMSFWLIDWVGKRRKKSLNTNYQLLIAVLMYALTLLPLHFSHFIGRPYNTLFGVDKILFGSTVGSAVFMLAVWADKKVRQVKGKQLFIYQKVVFPTSALLTASVILEVIIRSLR